MSVSPYNKNKLKCFIINNTCFYFDLVLYSDTFILWKIYIFNYLGLTLNTFKNQWKQKRISQKSGNQPSLVDRILENGVLVSVFLTASSSTILVKSQNIATCLKNERL